MSPVTVIAYTRSASTVEALCATSGLRVLRATTGDDLGRLLMSDHRIDWLVAEIPAGAPGRRVWRRLAIVRDEFPALSIAAALGDASAAWAGSGPPPCSMVLPVPFTAAELARTVGAAEPAPAGGDPAPGAPGEGRGRIIGVVGLGGGAGATTVTVVLAAVLARRGDHDVTVVDLDARNGNVAAALHLRPRAYVHDLVAGAGGIDGTDGTDLLQRALLPSGTGFLVLAGAEEPDDAVTVTAARPLLDRLTPPRATTLVDLGHVPARSYRHLDGVTELVVVVRHDVTAARRVPAAELALRTALPHVPVRVVLNRVDRQGPPPDQLARLMNRRWDAVVHDDWRITRARNIGVAMPTPVDRSLARRVTRPLLALAAAPTEPLHRAGVELPAPTG